MVAANYRANGHSLQLPSIQHHQPWHAINVHGEVLLENCGSNNVPKLTASDSEEALSILLSLFIPFCLNNCSINLTVDFWRCHTMCKSLGKSIIFIWNHFIFTECLQSLFLYFFALLVFLVLSCWFSLSEIPLILLKCDCLLYLPSPSVRIVSLVPSCPAISWCLRLCWQLAFVWTPALHHGLSPPWVCPLN